MAIITWGRRGKGTLHRETLPRLLAALEQYGSRDRHPLDILAAQRPSHGRSTKFIVPERVVGHCQLVPADEVAGWLKAGGLR